MPLNIYAGKSEAWLIERRNALQEILTRGAGGQTSVGIAGGVKHDFAQVSLEQIRRQLVDVLYALYLLNPDEFENPHAQKAMKASVVYA